LVEQHLKENIDFIVGDFNIVPDGVS